MTRITRPTGLTVTLPLNYQLAEIGAAEYEQRGRATRPSGPIPLPSSDGKNSAEQDTIIAALEKSGMLVLDKVELQPTPAAGSKRGGKPAVEKTSVEFSAELAPSEDAVLLLEHDGLYVWKFPDKIESVSGEATRRGLLAAPDQKRVTFSVDIAGVKPEAKSRSIISDYIFGKIKAVVLKFAARIAVGQAIKFLERNASTGLKTLDHSDPQKWTVTSDLSKLALPSDRPARVLLFIHDIFGSTVGSFGALTATPWGRKFLDAARQNFDAVLGFDHLTLSEDPLENASDLLQLLQSGNWKMPPHFRVIAHGRGGLVYRSLVEHLLPISNFNAYFDRAVFVAATNDGTKLAQPENWKTLIDLYTNIAVALFRLLGMIPQAKAVAVVLSELVQGLGAFVQYSATHATTEGGVPGLAAMQPDGNFIQTLNQEQPRQPTVATSYYCTITSEFKPRIFDGDHEPKEMSLRVVQWISEALAGQLMGEANDLVVDTRSMKAIDSAFGNFVKDSLDFGENPQVYHTNYFVRPEVVNALARWMQIVEPVIKSKLSHNSQVTHIERGKVVNRSKLRGSLRGGGGQRGGAVVSKRGRDLASGAFKSAGAAAGSVSVTVPPGTVGCYVGMGTAVGKELPVSVDTDIMVTDVDVPIGKCVAAIAEKSPSYVVLRRLHQGTTLNYAFPAEEIISEATSHPGDVTLLDALKLHESDASKTHSIYELVETSDASIGQHTTAREVVLVQDKPVGVVPEKKEVPSATDLVQMASIALSRHKNNAEEIVLRRTMPTFSSALPTKPPAMAESKAPQPTAKPDNVLCHFHAEMQSEVVVNRKATVEVIVSREVIGLLEGAAAKSGQADVDVSRKLIIQMIPRVNFEADGESRIEIDPPAPGNPQHIYFDLRAKHIGDGEVWILARQGQISLVTLILKPRVVEVGSNGQRTIHAAAETSEAPQLIEPLHQLRIYEQVWGDNVFYEFEFQSPSLDTLTLPLRSGFLKVDRRKYVEQRYKEIENYWVNNQDDAEAFASNLRAMGAELLSELVPKELQDILWNNRDKISSIQVLSTEPFIPWELVYLRNPNERGMKNKEGRFLGQMGLIRWLHGVGWPPNAVRLKKGRAHYVIPHYPHPDYVLEEAENEADFLIKNFGAKAVEPQPNPVRDLISEPGLFDLLHFACHGYAEQDNISNAQLMLEGRMENGKYIPTFLNATTAEGYSNLETPENRPMVVLNSCQTGRSGYKLTGLGGFAQAFLRGGAGVFVGALWSVGDNPARTFTETLYTHLLSGMNLAEATVKAREATREAKEATWLAYAVYGHPHMKITK